MTWVLIGLTVLTIVLLGARIIATNGFLNRVQTIISTDTGSLASATAMKVHLAQAAFVPSATLTIAGLTEATFTGYAAALAGIGNAQTFTDPTQGGNRILQLQEPANGWHFQVTGAAGLPQTIYGFYLTDNASAVLWGSALFSGPVTLSNIGDAIDIPQVRFALLGTALQ